MATITCDASSELTSNCGQSLDVWMKPLLARLRGAVPAVVRCELKAAIREFYLKTSAWREDVGPYNLKANRDTIYLNPVDAFSNVQFVVRAFTVINGARRDLVAHSIPFAPALTGEKPEKFHMQDPYTMVIDPIPTADLGRVLFIGASLVPTSDAEKMPAIATTHHFEAILDGALARLYMMPNKPYSDPLRAGAHQINFRRGISFWRDTAQRGNTFMDRPFQFPPFANQGRHRW